MNKKQVNLEYKKGYGKNFANLRKKEFNGIKDYPIRELAKLLNISHTSISFIEKETRPPTIEQINIYRKFFNVSLDYLAGYTSVSKPDLSMICEYTGLSEKAIENLCKFKEYICPSLCLNHLLECNVLDEILENLVDLFIDSYASFNDIPPDIPENQALSSIILSDYDEKSDLRRYRASECFSRLLDTFDYRTMNDKDFQKLKAIISVINENPRSIDESSDGE